MSPVLIVDTDRCAHDTVDGETMVIDTRTGHLLLFDGLASTLWDRLRTGTTADALLAETAERYGPDAAASTRAFIDELVAASLVVPTDAGPGSPPADAAPWPDDFAAPGIERFDEIADIMTMDPIHDVDSASGWPHASPAG